jgi:hypothetical protein
MSGMRGRAKVGSLYLKIMKKISHSKFSPNGLEHEGRSRALLFFPTHPKFFHEKFFELFLRGEWEGVSAFNYSVPQISYSRGSSSPVSFGLRLKTPLNRWYNDFLGG